MMTPSSLDVVTIILRHHNATVYTAVDGQDGIDKAYALKPDLIITDISMPIVDGWELIDTLKKDRAMIDIPIIALTAHAMVGDRQRALSAGCHNYLNQAHHTQHLPR